MYPWVPLVDLQSSILVRILATPKSDSLTTPVSVTRMFSGLMSVVQGTNRNYFCTTHSQ